MLRVTERHLDLPSTASGLAVDETDAVRAILGQPVFRMAHQQQLGQDQKAYPAEVAAIVALLEREIGIVEFRADHLLYVHDRNACASAMLQEFGVV